MSGQRNAVYTDKVPGKENMRLFDGTDAPCLGMHSYPVPTALSPGQWSYLQNIRLDDKSIRVKWGDAELTPIAFSAFQFQGGFQSEYGNNGNWLHAVAYGGGAGAQVHIYTNASPASATQVTATSGKYGDTRLRVPINGYMQYAVCHDRITKKDFLIVQSGDTNDYPRVVDLSGTTAAIHYPITPPKGTKSDGQHAGPDQFLAVSTVAAGTLTATVSGGGSASQQGAPGAGTAFFRFGFSVASVAGDVAAIRTNTANSITCSGLEPQVWLVLINSSATPDSDFFSKLKISIQDDTGALVTIHDPQNNIDSAVSNFFKPSTNAVLMGFPYSASSGDKIAGLRFEYRGSVVPANAQQIDVYGICTGGPVAGGSDYAFTYVNSGSQAESTVITNRGVKGRLLNQAGIATGGTTALSGFESFPYDANFRYRIRIVVRNTSTAERDKGTDQFRIYRRESGELQYVYANTVTLATWGGAAWAFSSGTALRAFVVDDSVAQEDKDYGVVAPDAQTFPMPIGKACLFANSRMYIGSARNQGVDTAYTDVMISEEGMPFRYRKAVRYFAPNVPDVTSATRVSFDSETVQAFFAASSSALGSSNVYCWTNKATYAFDGTDSVSLSRPRRIATAGTLSPHSVAERNGVIYWLDQDMIVREMQRGSPPVSISRYSVHDNLNNLPKTRRPFVSGKCIYGRYYLAYTSASGTIKNDRILVFNQDLGIWESCDLPYVVNNDPIVEQLGIWNDAGQLRLIAYSLIGKVYEYEQPGLTTVLGVPSVIPIFLRTMEFHRGLWDGIYTNGIGIVCDQDISNVGGISTSYTFKPDGAVTYGVIPLTSTNPTIWRWDRTSYGTVAPTGGKGLSCIIILQANLSGGTRIYSLVCATGKVEGQDADVK